MNHLTMQHPQSDSTPGRLGEEQAQRLLSRVPGWSIEHGKLTRDQKVENFKAALALLNRIGEVAEAQNHHPDLTIHRWNHVRIEFYTHTVEGLTENDFAMAARVNELLSA